jgi:gp16 family phage-associated protein
MDEAGISLAEWARAHGLSYDVARGVLSGRIKAKRGQAHRIAVALGLKQGRVVAPRLYAPPPAKPAANLKLVGGAK